MSLSIFNLRRLVAGLVMAVAALVGGSVFAQENGPGSVVGGPVSPKVVGLSVVSQSPNAAKFAVQKPDFSYEMKVMASADIRQTFPRMKMSDIEILGKCTPDYNCIGYSLELKQWVNPETGSEDNRLERMDAMYAQIGYVRQDSLNFEKEAGLEKVVVYAKLNVDGSIAEVTHAARQDVDGTWTSKLGRAPLIRHKTPEVLRGPGYGAPVAVYVRKAQHS